MRGNTESYDAALGNPPDTTARTRRFPCASHAVMEPLSERPNHQNFVRESLYVMASF